MIGIVLVGYRHFDNVQTGVAAASLYLLLPSTAQLTREIDHVIPGAVLVWSVESYRRPVWSGLLFGIAAGLIFYPLFLLPLWCSFYWRRGLLRFLVPADGGHFVEVERFRLDSIVEEVRAVRRTPGDDAVRAVPLLRAGLA